TVQGRGGGTCQQDGPHRLGRCWLRAAPIGRLRLRQRRKESGYGRMSCVCAFTNCRGDDDVDANGRDRRLGKPVMGHAIVERVLLFGTRSADYIRASGHSGCIEMEVSPPFENRPYTWLHPNASQISQIPLAPRAPSIHGPSRHVAPRSLTVAFGAKRTLVGRPPQRVYEYASKLSN